MTLTGTVSFTLTSSADSAQQTTTKPVTINFAHNPASNLQAYGTFDPDPFTFSEAVVASNPVSLTVTGIADPETLTVGAIVQGQGAPPNCNFVSPTTIPANQSINFNCSFSDNGTMPATGTIPFTFTDAVSNTTHSYSLAYNYTKT